MEFVKEFYTRSFDTKNKILRHLVSTSAVYDFSLVGLIRVLPSFGSQVGPNA